MQHHTPIPTQIVSSHEFYPDPQNERQREVEARLLAMADDLGGKQGLDRRRFFQSAAGMAASFVAMTPTAAARSPTADCLQTSGTLLGVPDVLSNQMLAGHITSASPLKADK